MLSWMQWSDPLENSVLAMFDEFVPALSKVGRLCGLCGALIYLAAAYHVRNNFRKYFRGH